MKASQIKQILAETAAQTGYRGESRLWKIRDLRTAGLDFETARFAVDNPDLIDLLDAPESIENFYRNFPL